MKVFLLAVLVTMTTVFAACSSDDSVTESPELNELGDVVRAQFSISIPMTTGGTTRMSSDVVQSDGSVPQFRGINEIKLFPSAETADAFSASSQIGRSISLTELKAPSNGTVDNVIPAGKLLGASKSVLYGDVQLQIGTRTFLFYGKAIGKDNGDALSSYTADDFIKYGYLDRTMTDGATDVSGFKFTPLAIVDDDTKTNSQSKRDSICTYLAQIANAEVPAADGGEKWRQTTNKGFEALFNSFVSMKAGSSNNLKVAIHDLYVSAKQIYENGGNKLAKAICDAITANNYVTVGDDDNSITFSAGIDNYPRNINLPDGAAVLSHSTGSDGKVTFSFAETDANYVNLNVTGIGQYAYPASLYYWGKSDIRTADESKSAYYTDDATWGDDGDNDIFKQYDAANNAVTPSTRSVLLTKPVQYAVGRLDYAVAAANSSLGGKLADAGSGTNVHSIDPANIKLTGILIGGQKNVGWNFEPVAADVEYTVYDNIEKSQSASGGVALATSLGSSYDFTPMGQTLVLETAGVEDETVNIALEFVNNDQDFYGKDGIVPMGCKFYLVGALKMNPSDGSGTTTKPSGYTDNKVFKQDFRTVAKFTIKSLAQAQNTIPDLRNPQVELGLSVDLTWQDGVIFDVPID